MQATKLSQVEITKIQARIKELEATPRAMGGSDSGTHGEPGIHHIYEEITGERYVTYSFANANATRCTEEQAEEDTDGRIRRFPNAQAEIREKAAELKRLREQLRKANL